jgi:cyanophycin synthetase
MNVSRVRMLRGPNLWSRHFSIEAVVACSEEESVIDSVPGFEARVRARFPELGQLQPKGHAAPMSMAHVLEAATLGLQIQAGCPVTFSRTQATVDAGTFQVVVEFTEEAVGRMAFDLAQELIAAARDDTPFYLAAALAALRELDEDVRLGPSTGAIVHAAVLHNIPFRRLTDGSLVQFGWGSKQRRIQAAEIDSTSAIAESIAQDKQLTKRLLKAAGASVPTGRPVSDIDDAWAAALEIGLPVVVKPQDGNQGKGVTVNIVTRDHLEIAYNAAREFRSKIMVESYMPGHDFRMLVVGDKLIAAARRDSPFVVGDGVHTIIELVAQINTDPRRGDGHATPLTRIRIDEIAVARIAIQGFKPESIPPKGQRVVLRNNANLSTGGTATDVTDDVHPDVAASAIAAAQMIGLDICGVDVVAESVLKPLEETGGGIVEVNAAPGLRMHIAPSYGKGRAVGEAIVSALYPDGGDGRIPVVAVTGTNGKTTTVRLIAHIIATSGLRVGMTNTDGVYVDGRRVDTGDCSGPKSARNVLMHPDVDAAVFETARGGMLREGLAFDRCQVAVVTNIGLGDHLGLNYITSVADLAVLKRVIVQNVAASGVGVLNAADPLVARMAGDCPGSITYFAADDALPVMTAHRAHGNRLIYVAGNSIVAEHGKEKHTIALSEIPITHGGTISFQTENAMASIGAAWALGLPWEVIKEALKTFNNSVDSAPGRFNIFSYRGATLIADYGHNPDAIAALTKAIEAMPAKRRMVVISAAGDRRDEDIRQQTEILGTAFDDVLLYQDACQRGRADGEVIGLLRQGLVGAPKTSYVEEIQGEFVAIDTALARLQAGDLCLILVDQVEEALDYISKKVSSVAL